MRQDRGRGGAVAYGVTGPLSRLPQQLGTEVLVWVAELEAFGNGHSVVADQRFAPFLLQQHRLRFGPEGDSHRVGQRLCSF